MTRETRQRLRERQWREVQESRRRGQENKQGGQDGEQRQLRTVTLDQIRRRIERVAITVMRVARKVDGEMNVSDVLMGRAVGSRCMRAVVVMKVVMERQCRRYQDEQNQYLTDSACTGRGMLMEEIHVARQALFGDPKLALPLRRVNTRGPTGGARNRHTRCVGSASIPTDIR